MSSNTIAIRFAVVSTSDRLHLLHVLATDPQNFAAGAGHRRELRIGGIEFTDSHTFCILKGDPEQRRQALFTLIPWLCQIFSEHFQEKPITFVANLLIMQDTMFLPDAPEGIVYGSEHCPSPRSSFLLTKTCYDYAQLGRAKQEARFQAFVDELLALRGQRAQESSYAVYSVRNATKGTGRIDFCQQFGKF